MIFFVEEYLSFFTWPEAKPTIYHSSYLNISPSKNPKLIGKPSQPLWPYALSLSNTVRTKSKDFFFMRNYVQISIQTDVLVKVIFCTIVFLIY